MENVKEKFKYHRENDYLLPNVAIPNSKYNNYQIGKYGYLGLEYLKKHKRGYYTELMLDGTLLMHIVDIDKEANKQEKYIIKNLAKANNTDEMLKQNNPFEWVKMMNNFKNSAEEIVLKDLIFN